MQFSKWSNLMIVLMDMPGSIMRIHHFDHGHLLDDGSIATSNYELDSGCCFPPLWHFGHGHSLHGLHEGNICHIHFFFVCEFRC